MSETRHIRLALAMARKSTSKYRLGAVVAHSKRVIATGYNQMNKTHPLMNKLNGGHCWQRGLHAEIHACIGLPARDLLDADIYVARIRKNGEPAMSRPCNMCQRFLMSVGVRAVYFTTDENTVGTLWLGEVH